jgi:hypothetical protein
MHDEFRVIALANRPGYPFLGNDFFREMGDVFACHVVENPDLVRAITMHGCACADLCTDLCVCVCVGGGGV